MAFAPREGHLILGLMTSQTTLFRIRKFDLEGFVQRIVEDGISGFVDQARQEDDVGSAKGRPSEIDAPDNEGSNNEQAR
jgi:hypothetical protein